MNPEAEKILEPSRQFYRLTFLLGTFLSPSALLIAEYLHEALPYQFRYFYAFSLLSFFMFLYTFKRKLYPLRYSFLFTAFVFCIYFQWISYSIQFHYSTLIAQILLLVSATFVMLRLRELVIFLVLYGISDGFFTILNWELILNHPPYKIEYIHYHIFLFTMISLGVISLFNRRNQVYQLDEILRAKEQAYEFAKESRRQMEDMEFALNAASIVAITDNRGIITYANENFQKISGYTAEELLGKTHRIVNSGLHPQEFFKEMWDTILSGKVWKGEIRNKRKDGSYYWVATTIVPLTDGGNHKPNRFLAIRNDITPRKIAEERLRESEERFRKLYNHLKEELQIAAQTQKYLMPRVESIPGIQINTFVKPYIDVSGDLIAIKRSGNWIHILLADIAGHGVSSALISGLVVYVFHQTQDHEITRDGSLSPSQALLNIRDKIHSLNVDEFVCGTYLILNLDTKELAYSYAGQLPGILFRKDNSQPLEGRGMPLLPNIPLVLRDYQFSLVPGDRLLFFSDGVYEIKNSAGEYLGYEAFVPIAHQSILDSINPTESVMQKIMNYCSYNPSDDISILYLEVLNLENL